MVVKTNTLGGEAAGKSHARSEVSGQILAFAFVAWRLRKVLSWPIFRYGVRPFSCGPCIRKSWAEGLSELLETDRFQDSPFLDVTIWPHQGGRTCRWRSLKTHHPSNLILPASASCRIKPSRGSKSRVQGACLSTRVVSALPALHRYIIPLGLKSISLEWSSPASGGARRRTTCMRVTQPYDASSRVSGNSATSRGSFPASCIITCRNL